MVVNTTSIVGQCTKLIDVLTAVDAEGEFNIPHLQKNTIEGQRIAKQVRTRAARPQMPRQHTSDSRASERSAARNMIEGQSVVSITSVRGDLGVVQHARAYLPRPTPSALKYVSHSSFMCTSFMCELMCTSSVCLLMAVQRSWSDWQCAGIPAGW